MASRVAYEVRHQHVLAIQQMDSSLLMNTKFPSSYDVVVVGSGHNGLVAAAYLSMAGKSVLVLEKNQEFGGATASQRVFPDYDALLSRYSYLVSLLPTKIVKDLGLKFETRRRTTASFTPWVDSGGSQRGLLLSNVDETSSRDSMFAMTGKHEAWDRYQEFLALQTELAKLVWPTMLSPLRSRESFESECKTEMQQKAWRSFVERPLGEAIEEYAEHDALRGLLMTDGKIGVFTHAHDPSLLQNRCFLYHVIGNETGEWRVPVGGMRSLVQSLIQVCTKNGVHFASSAEVVNIAQGEPQHEVTFHLMDSAQGDREQVAGDQITGGQGNLAVGRSEQSVACDYVLVNAGQRTFCQLLNKTWKPSDRNEGSVVKINMLLKRLPKLKASGISATEAFSGSFHIDEGYEQMVASYESAAKGKIPVPVPGEVYCHTLTDNSILSEELNSQGFHTLTLFGLDMPWRLFENDHDSRKQQVTELYLAGLNNLADDEFEDCLALDSHGRPCIEIKTPQELQAEIGLDQGNIFHSELSWFYGEEGSSGSWGVETEFPRILLAGSSASRGGAVSGIPGHNAAMCVLNS